MNGAEELGLLLRGDVLGQIVGEGQRADGDVHTRKLWLRGWLERVGCSRKRGAYRALLHCQ